MERTFSINGATITVRPATIRDAIQRDMLASVVIDHDPDISVEAILFATQCAQSTMDGEIDGWTLPASNAPTDEVVASFEGWMALPGRVFRLWQNALAEVDGIDAEDEEKKAPG